ncbi:MAG: DegT/DnrJ/EryC1/StrS family aminotransferase [Patescibacteria group bacterium]
MFIPVNEPIISQEAKDNLAEAINSGWISSAGKYLSEFETNFAKIYGVKHAIAVSNGTAALHVALLSLGIKAGDEIIVPAFTMAASWMAVLYTGAKPIFVDCELETYNIDPDKIEKKITAHTKAIMPVHIYGHPCEMNKIMNLAQKYKLMMIEDAAEAHGATYQGKLAGIFGDISCFSFYGNKIITTGEGGIIITNSDTLAEKCRKIKDLHHSAKRFVHDGIGYNYRLTNMQAAIGVGELKHLDEYVNKKLWIAKLYSELLVNIPGLKLPTTKTGVKNVFWMYAILIYPKKFGLSRDNLKIELKNRGVDTRDFFYSPSDQPVLKDIINAERFPNTELIASNGLYLPSGLTMTEEKIKFVCQQIKKIRLTK